MAKAKNVLWIMCDQLRYDYLCCTGHPTLETPNIDAMAQRGVRFTRAYVQSPICGPSRMSFYTGRYMRSHGSHWNGWPLRVGEPTLGDHLEKHRRPQRAGRQDPHGAGSRRASSGSASRRIRSSACMSAQCGFEPYERDDGLHPPGRPAAAPTTPICASTALTPTIRGSTGPIPAQADDGNMLNGWLLVHADKAARVPEEHSETPYMTRRAMDFIAEAEAGRPARGACTCPTSSRTGPTSRPSPTPACTAPTKCCRRCAREEERARRASGVRRLHGHALSRKTSRATSVREK